MVPEPIIGRTLGRGHTEPSERQVMSTTKQAKAKRLNQSQRAEALKEVHFPWTVAPFVWSRKDHDGYTTVPRTLPIAMQAVDALCKGMPPGHVLFSLWARTPDHPLLTIESQAVFAAEAGFTGERAVDTWRKRMRHLRTHHFIDTKAGPSGDLHYVLLINPNLAVESLRRRGKVNDEIYGRFVDRMHEIGASTELATIQSKLDEAAKTSSEQAV